MFASRANLRRRSRYDLGRPMVRGMIFSVAMTFNLLLGFYLLFVLGNIQIGGGFGEGLDLEDSEKFLRYDQELEKIPQILE
jgi:hypothetical protein